MPPLAAAAVLALLAPAAEPSGGGGPEPAAIQAVLAQESAAWARGDAEGFAAAVREDVVFTNIVGMFSVGKAPFVAQHRRIFDGVYKGSTMTQAVEHIAFVKPDVAVVDTVAEVRGYKGLPPGVQAIDGALRTRLEQVMVHEGGAWRVAAFHNVVVNAAALAGSPPAPPTR